MSLRFTIDRAPRDPEQLSKSGLVWGAVLNPVAEFPVSTGTEQRNVKNEDEGESPGRCVVHCARAMLRCPECGAFPSVWSVTSGNFWRCSLCQLWNVIDPTLRGRGTQERKDSGSDDINPIRLRFWPDKRRCNLLEFIAPWFDVVLPLGAPQKPSPQLMAHIQVPTKRTGQSQSVPVPLDAFGCPLPRGDKEAAVEDEQSDASSEEADLFDTHIVPHSPPFQLAGSTVDWSERERWKRVAEFGGLTQYHRLLSYIQESRSHLPTTVFLIDLSGSEVSVQAQCDAVTLALESCDPDGYVGLFAYGQGQMYVWGLHGCRSGDTPAVCKRVPVGQGDQSRKAAGRSGFADALRTDNDKLSSVRLNNELNRLHRAFPLESGGLERVMCPCVALAPLHTCSNRLWKILAGLPGRIGELIGGSKTAVPEDRRRPYGEVVWHLLRYLQFGKEVRSGAQFCLAHHTCDAYSARDTAQSNLLAELKQSFAHGTHVHHSVRLVSFLCGIPNDSVGDLVCHSVGYMASRQRCVSSDEAGDVAVMCNRADSLLLDCSGEMQQSSLLSPLRQAETGKQDPCTSGGAIFYEYLGNRAASLGVCTYAYVLLEADAAEAHANSREDGISGASESRSSVFAGQQPASEVLDFCPPGGVDVAALRSVAEGSGGDVAVYVVYPNAASDQKQGEAAKYCCRVARDLARMVGRPMCGQVRLELRTPPILTASSPFGHLRPMHVAGAERDESEAVPSGYLVSRSDQSCSVGPLASVIDPGVVEAPLPSADWCGDWSGGDQLPWKSGGRLLCAGEWPVWKHACFELAFCHRDGFATGRIKGLDRSKWSSHESVDENGVATDESSLPRHRRPNRSVRAPRDFTHFEPAVQTVTSFVAMNRVRVMLPVERKGEVSWRLAEVRVPVRVARVLTRQIPVCTSFSQLYTHCSPVELSHLLTSNMARLASSESLIRARFVLSTWFSRLLASYNVRLSTSGVVNDREWSKLQAQSQLEMKHLCLDFRASKNLRFLPRLVMALGKIPMFSSHLHHPDARSSLLSYAPALGSSALSTLVYPGLSGWKWVSSSDEHKGSNGSGAPGQFQRAHRVMFLSQSVIDKSEDVDVYVFNSVNEVLLVYRYGWIPLADIGKRKASVQVSHQHADGQVLPLQFRGTEKGGFVPARAPYPPPPNDPLLKYVRTLFKDNPHRSVHLRVLNAQYKVVMQDGECLQETGHPSVMRYLWARCLEDEQVGGEGYDAFMERHTQNAVRYINFDSHFNPKNYY